MFAACSVALLAWRRPETSKVTIVTLLIVLIASSLTALVNVVVRPSLLDRFNDGAFFLVIAAFVTSIADWAYEKWFASRVPQAPAKPPPPPPPPKPVDDDGAEKGKPAVDRPSAAARAKRRIVAFVLPGGQSCV